MILELPRKIELKYGTILKMFDINELRWNDVTIVSVDEDKSRVVVMDERGYEYFENKGQLANSDFFRFA